VSFNSAGGTAVAARLVQSGRTIGAMPANPVRQHFNFAGWWTLPSGGSPVHAATVVSGHMTVHARWTPIMRTLSFNSTGGNRINNRVVHSGQAKGSLPTPRRAGYRFAGWFVGDRRMTPQSIVVANTNLRARWNRTDAMLRRLRVSNGRMNRAFEEARRSYTVRLPRNRAVTTIRTTRLDPRQRIDIRVGNAQWRRVTSQRVSLDRGRSVTVRIRVTERSMQPVVYTVRVVRPR
jgi:uncharacterized repeat protein (TIGR02543 family)